MTEDRRQINEFGRGNAEGGKMEVEKV